MIGGPLKLSETKGPDYSYALLQYSPFDREPPRPRRWSNRRRVSAMVRRAREGAFVGTARARSRPRQSQASRNSIVSGVRRVSELFHKRDVRPPSYQAALTASAPGRRSGGRCRCLCLPHTGLRPVPPFSASRRCRRTARRGLRRRTAGRGPGRRKRADRGPVTAADGHSLPASAAEHIVAASKQAVWLPRGSWHAVPRHRQGKLIAVAPLFHAALG